MANQKKETKDKLANSQKDAKEIKQKTKKEQTTPLKTSSNAKSQGKGKCPPGQVWNPVTGQCE